MNDFKVGEVTICDTGQAGTIIDIYKRDAWILLRNDNVWVGSISRIRKPQGQEDLDACPINVERIEPKIKRKEN